MERMTVGAKLRELPLAILARRSGRVLLLIAAVFSSVACVPAQSVAPPAQSNAQSNTHHARRAARFLSGRQSIDPTVNPAAARQLATTQHLALAAANAVSPHYSALTQTWQSVGPAQVSSISYGAVTGRVSSIAIDPSDSTGNTVFVGTNAGGLWKSTSAAGTAGSVAFTPLTDSLSVFSISSGSSAIASLSIGAVTVQPGGTGVVLAGTGDTNDATDSYFGEGILRSADHGQTWSLIQSSQDGTAGTHSFIGNGFAGFAWSTSNSALVVAAVSQAAEGVIVNAPTARYSVLGPYYSADSGATWQMGTILDGTQTVQSPSLSYTSYFGNAVTSVVWNPIRNLFFAAIRNHGFYSSVDGITWTRLTNQPGVNLTTTNCPANHGLPASVACPIFRGVLAVDSTTGDTFALSVDNNNLDQGLWRDTCNLTSGHCASSTVTFATRLTDTPLETSSTNTTIPQADYDLYLAAVHSGTDTILFAGTEDIYRCSLNAGCVFRNTTNAYSCAAAQVSPAQHAVDFLAAAGPLMYFGNDGGLWRSTDGVNQQQAVCSADDANHFQNLNSGLGSLADVVSLAAHPSDATQLLAGLGANGTAASEGSATPTSIWPQLSSGEGGTAAIDASNPSNWYVTTSDGISINLCPNSESCTASDFAAAPQIGYTQVSGDQALIDAPWILDPALPSQLIAGTCRIWRGAASGGSNWNAGDLISPMLDGVSNTYCNGNALIRSLGAGGASIPNAGSQVLYAGMAGLLDGGGIKSGHIFSTSSASTANAGTVWTDLYSSTVSNDTANSGRFNPGNFDIASIAVDPHDATGNTVYAAVMGFSGNAYSVPHIYMSTTGGATWTNISSNLPNTPANAVLVDPNNANTVYVAMDTGVYVTQAVSTCSTATVNCWDVFGVGLPNAPVTQLAAIPGSSLLAVGTYGRGVWQLPLASTLPPTTYSLNPTSLTFLSQQTNTTSTAQSITVTNTGSTALEVSSLAITGNYSQTNNCTTAPIAINSSCTVNVIFAPLTPAILTGTLSLYANVDGGVIAAGLTGQGTAPPAPVISFSPTSLSFSRLNVSSTSTAQTITVTNSGTAALVISQVSLQGFFSQTNNCVGTVAIGGYCTLNVTFTPQVPGPLFGSITLTANISGSTASVPLSGTGIAVGTLSASPTSINFGNIYYLNNSATMPVLIQNTGTAPVNISTLALSTSSFTETDNCAGATLAVSATCTANVTFYAAAYFANNATLTVNSDASNNPLTVSLTGYGLSAANVTVSMSPNSLSFGSVSQGSSSALLSTTLTVTSSSWLNPPTITITGDFTENDTCYVAIYHNNPCTIGVIFTPTANGPRTGNLTISGNLIGGPILVPLGGTGTPGALVTASVPSVVFPSVVVGGSTTSTVITINNSGAAAATLATPVLAGDFSISSTTCGTTLPISTTCTISVIFTPSIAGARGGSLSIVNNGSGGTVSVSLSGTGLTPADVTLSPPSITFPGGLINSPSVAIAATLTNTGGVAATLDTPQITGDFSLSSTTCGASLAASTACNLYIVFTPTARGIRTGSISVGNDGTGGTVSTSLTGTGLSAATVTIAPSTVSFPSQLIQTSSTAIPVTLTNAGDSTATLSTPQITGDFTLASTTCGTSLLGSATCTLYIVFNPTTTGTRAGSLLVANSGTTGTVSASLSGTGATAASVAISPIVFSFANTDVGSSSTAQNFILTNSGGLPATLATPQITGDFSIASTTCSTTLAASATCTLSVLFTPSTSGPRGGALSVATSGTTGTVSSTLSGTGLTVATVTISPGSVSFPSEVIGSPSIAIAVTLDNVGAIAATLDIPQITGDFSVSSTTCGNSLPATSTCSIWILFTPTLRGVRAGSLTVGNSGSRGTVSTTLSGTGLSPATVTIAPLTVPFPNELVQSSSPAIAVTLSNTGEVTATLGTPQISGDFTISSTTCTTTLLSTATCTVWVVFTPTTTGVRTGTLSVANSGTSGAASAILTGNGSAAASVSLSPTVFSFVNTNIGSSSAAANFVVANTGGLSATLTAAQISGDFAISANTCTTTLAGNSSCTVSILFSPTAGGTRTGAFQIGSSTGTLTATLSGIGLSPATDVLSTNFLIFPSQIEGTSSTAQTVTLTNSGDNSLNTLTLQISGDFTAVSGCGASLAGHSSCAVNISYAPKNIGAETGTLTFLDSLRTQSVSLTGSAIAPAGVSLSPLNGISFGAVGLSQSSAQQLVTLTNNGGAPLAVSGITITSAGDFAIPVGQNNCPISLTGGSSCSIGVVFTPLISGARTGTLTVTDSAGNSPQSIPLTGTGMDFTLGATGVTTQTVSTGQTAVYSLTVTPAAAGLTNAITFACTGAPTDSTCVVTTAPSSPTLSGAVTLTVTVATGVNPDSRGGLQSRSTVQSRPGPAPTAIALGFLFLPAACFLFRRRKLTAWLALCLILIATAGCGSGGRLIPDSSSSGSSGTGSGTVTYTTPSGTYTLNLSATAGGITHSQSLSLTVK